MNFDSQAVAFDFKCAENQDSRVQGHLKEVDNAIFSP